MGAAPSGQRFYNSLLHRGLGSLGPQWYGLDVVCAKPHLRGWKVRNGTPGEAENRVQPDDQPDELDFIRALAAEIRFVVAAADIDSADGDGLPDKDSSTGSSTGRDGIGRDAAVRSGTSVGAKVKLRGRDRYGSTWENTAIRRLITRRSQVQILPPPPTKHQVRGPFPRYRRGPLWRFRGSFYTSFYTAGWDAL